MKQFADRLKASRERAGLTQAQLADQMGVHRFTVAKWEQGLHPPGKPTDFDDLAFHLNCSVAWLREGAGEMGAYNTTLTTDRDRRQEVVRRARLRARGVLLSVSPGDRGEHGPSDKVDWSLVSLCAILLLQADPGLDLKALARALPLFYSVALRAPGSCDLTMAMHILQAMA